MKNSKIDAGREFDWGRVSKDYAKYRDIYPDEFYNKIACRGLCTDGQCVLDIGTGTGVLARNMYKFGASWTGIDISPQQIAEAQRLAESAGMKIAFKAIPAEQADFPDESFDVITACQCFWYFDHALLAPVLKRMLKPDGRLVILSMAWLPYEDEIAGASERLVLKYSPKWSGAGMTRKPIGIPSPILDCFEPVEHEEFDLMIPFTRESWNGRMKACRGVGASLAPSETAAWEQEHMRLLSEIAPDRFDILHSAAIAVLKIRQ